MEQKIKLGDAAKDKVTGFSGTATAIAEHIGGYQSIQIGALGTDGTIKEEWIEATRVVAVE